MAITITGHAVPTEGIALLGREELREELAAIYAEMTVPDGTLTMAELVATGKTPELIAPFGLDRFGRGNLMGEKGAAAVGH